MRQSGKCTNDAIRRECLLSLTLLRLESKNDKTICQEECLGVTDNKYGDRKSN